MLQKDYARYHTHKHTFKHMIQLNSRQHTKGDKPALTLMTLCSPLKMTSCGDQWSKLVTSAVSPPMPLVTEVNRFYTSQRNCKSTHTHTHSHKIYFRSPGGGYILQSQLSTGWGLSTSTYPCAIFLCKVILGSTYFKKRRDGRIFTQSWWKNYQIS